MKINPRKKQSCQSHSDYHSDCSIVGKMDDRNAALYCSG